jgi:hypothetical protein
MPPPNTNLVMVALGVKDDAPVSELQPPLPDGIHLRWAFRPERGFPWFGYHLFRRVHQETDKVRCLGTAAADLKPQTLAERERRFGGFTVSSERPLVLTDDFPGAGRVEWDLEGRRALRVALPETARSVVVRIGLRRDLQPAVKCVDLRQRQPGTGPNPRVEEGVTFHVHDRAGKPYPGTRIVAADGSVGLDTGYGLDVSLPCAASGVELLLTPFAGPAVLEALDAQGNVVDTAATAGLRTPQTVRLEGAGTVRVRVTAPENKILLHRVCYECPPAGSASGGIQVTAYHGGVPVDGGTAQGAAGAVVPVVLEADSITRVEIAGGPAALVDVCFVPLTAGLDTGWEFVPELPYPLCLPVAHPDYPCPGRPASEGEAEHAAVSRVQYGDPEAWRGDRFAELHGELRRLVDGGSAGGPMAGRATPEVDPAGAGATAAHIRARRPLDAVLLAAVHPPLAQMVGLYWVDRTASADVAYDYIVLADHDGLWRGDGAAALRWLLDGPDFGRADAAVVFNRRMGTARALAAPTGLRAYALPGATAAAGDGEVADAGNNVGLRWERYLTADGVLLPGRPLLYHVWRAGPFAAAPRTPPPPERYRPVTRGRPVPVAEAAASGAAPERPADWPRFPMHALDGGLADGWYAYRVSGIDLFGRHSPGSAPAEWRQWEPVPVPRPWYFTDPPGDRAVHPFAVGCLDKAPPPPPTGVEAYYLDPRDQTVVRDAAYQAWRAALEAAPWFQALGQAERERFAGLRVRWRWPRGHMRQAPDLREFRVYFHPGRLNARVGRTRAVLPAGALESVVETDISAAEAADAFVGTALRVGEDLFPILGSDAGGPLRLRVRNLGPAGDLRPRPGEPCSVSYPPGHPLHVDYARPTRWDERLYVVPAGARYTPGVEPAAGEAPLGGTGATATGTTVLLPPGTDLSVVRAGRHHLILAGDAARAERTYRVVAVDAAARTLTLDAAPALGTPSAWAIGIPVRAYELFLPDPAGGPEGARALATPVDAPVAYAHLGVSAADGRRHTGDDPRWAGTRWGGADRYGNEGRVGGPATVFAVRRDPPGPPAPPPADSDRVYATAADYHGRSFHTFRWTPSPALGTHVFRAVDDAVFQVDWALRPRPPLDPADGRLFPDAAAEPRWDAAKRAQVAAELDALNGRPGRDEAMAAYRALSNDGLRVLAGLPGNDAAFTQVTIQPLDPAERDPANPALLRWRDRVGPDTDPAYVPAAGLRSWMDTLDGRATNRYLYRAAYVDGAHNRGPLGLSSPPVWLPNVVPPRAPVLTGVLGGERQVTLRWASNREPDLVEYRVYRADTDEEAADLRRMTRVQTVPVAVGDPLARPASVSWTDTPVAAGRPFYYRVAAVDDAGNVSAASPAAAGRATDTTPPAPAAWQDARWMRLDAAGNERPWADTTPGLAPAVRLEWTGEDPAFESLLQRRTGPTALWRTVASWVRVEIYRDGDVDPGAEYEYRVLTRKPNGLSTPSPVIPAGGRSRTSSARRTTAPTTWPPGTASSGRPATSTTPAAAESSWSASRARPCRSWTASGTCSPSPTAFCRSRATRSSCACPASSRTGQAPATTPAFSSTTLRHGGRSSGTCSTGSRRFRRRFATPSARSCRMRRIPGARSCGSSGPHSGSPSRCRPFWTPARTSNSSWTTSCSGGWRSSCGQATSSGTSGTSPSSSSSWIRAATTPPSRRPRQVGPSTRRTSCTWCRRRGTRRP